MAVGPFNASQTGLSLLGAALLTAPMSADAATLNQPKPLVASYLKDLEQQGYCVIPGVLSAPETEVLNQRVWHEFIEKAWPNCKMDDRSNWKETFPRHNRMGIFAGPAGQTQVMWDIRQDPRIVDIFANVWGTPDLIVSMDGLSLMCPPEIREGSIEPWPHVDQTIIRRQDNVGHNNNPPPGFVSESPLKTQPYTIQGQFLFEGSSVVDGGFYCIPQSHYRFTEFAPQLEKLNEIPDGIERRRAKTKFIDEFFQGYCKQHITAPKGSVILWDSRTVHWNQHASEDRTDPKVRMVGYICYVPKTRLTEEGRLIRKEAFEKGVSTGHNPAYPELKETKAHLYGEYEQYLEDRGYTQPTINLTPLGESLLGITTK